MVKTSLTTEKLIELASDKEVNIQYYDRVEITLPAFKVSNREYSTNLIKFVYIYTVDADTRGGTRSNKKQIHRISWGHISDINEGNILVKLAELTKSDAKLIIKRGDVLGEYKEEKRRELKRIEDFKKQSKENENENKN